MSNAAPMMRGSLFARGEAKTCMVRMTSDSEACLVVYSPERLPGRFRLFIYDTQSEVDCSVMWRGSKEVGVRLHDGIAADQKGDRASDGQVISLRGRPVPPTSPIVSHDRDQFSPGDEVEVLSV